ncbi:MAG: aspartate-semialdehyde dehydrogenase [Rhodospirillales bacterium]|jgi:aspartate-semialdehyde dehydrogenase|nr:aspartate-semialdehyde dehydrogenase [Rhodospirillales bacterium]MDB5383490.1 aspartate-semialdehyde dehydrogenase [Rhodospirillales bacterium]
MPHRIAIIGATTALGREIVKTLAEREFPVSLAHALASGRALGQQLSFGDDIVLTVRAIDAFDFTTVDLAIFAGARAMSATHAPRAAAAGCVVIDCTEEFRMEAGIPLVIPEVNPQAIKAIPKRRIIANPTSAVVPMLMALKPMHGLARIKRISVATYQSVSEAGKESMDELWSQTRAMFVNEMPPPEHFPKQIAFNCIPQTDTIAGDGATRTETAMAQETRKILDPDIAVMATCVRVPVFIGTAAAVHVEFEGAVTEAEARAAWRAAPGVTLLDTREDGGYTTPAETVGEDSVYVSRLRRDPSVPFGLAFWCTADNLRKGGALNAVQIAEALRRNGLIGEAPTAKTS